MMTSEHNWQLFMSKTFINEIFDLPVPVKNDLSQVVGRFKRDPLYTGYNTRKIKNTNIYRIKYRHKYRLFYTIENGSITFLSIRKRRENTYKGLPIPGPLTVLTAEGAAELKSEPQTESLQQPAIATNNLLNSEFKKLPKNLTRHNLKKWKIPGEYWRDLMATKTESELLNLELPDRIFGRILDNLFPSSLKEIQDEPKYHLMKPEDLDRFLEGDITEFLLELDPKQKDLVNSEMKGPILIKGGPGTGKSIIALYRIKKLVDSGHQSILFVTHSAALVTYSQQLLEQLLGDKLERLGVEVKTVDHLVRQHYQQSQSHPRIADNKQCKRCLKEALDIVKKTDEKHQIRTLEKLENLGFNYLIEEFVNVIEGWGISTLEVYKNHPRQGRGFPLHPSTRTVLWHLYHTWKWVMEQKGWIVWKQMCRMALETVRVETQKPYQAIIVDEAQDLSPVALRFVLALTPTCDRVYLTADASQSIHQRGFSWKQIHGELKITGHTSILRQNYRNTRQIAIACADIMAGEDEFSESKPSPYLGNWPAIYLTDDRDLEGVAIGQFLLDSAKKFRLPLHGGAILCPTKKIGKKIAARMRQLGLQATFISGKKIDLNRPKIKVLTLDDAKGLEFPFVAVVGLEESTLPHLEKSQPEEEKQIVLDQQRRLFYVGCTRAMRSLLVVGSKSSPSQFIDRLPPEHWRREYL
ncbi:MAG: UvrD-helicase domain-containing protein [Limnospira sp.]